jgi:hypothetical protein
LGSVESALEYPNTAAVAPHLYGSLEEQFGYARTASRLDARARIA